MSNKPSKKPQKKAKKSVVCPVCGAKIQMVTGEQMNFRFYPPDAASKIYFRCSNYPACDTYIAANPKTKQLDGLLAGPSLRHKRIVLHSWEVFLGEHKRMDRTAFREMCASQIGFRKQEHVHASYMTERECDTILNYLKSLYENNKDIHDLVEQFPNHTVWKEVHGFNTAPNHGIHYNADGTIKPFIQRGGTD